MPVYAVAREWFERALAAAEARGRRQDARLIAARLCEVIEQEDFDEVRRLDDQRDGDCADVGAGIPSGPCD